MQYILVDGGEGKWKLACYLCSFFKSPSGIHQNAGGRRVTPPYHMEWSSVDRNDFLVRLFNLCNGKRVPNFLFHAPFWWPYQNCPDRFLIGVKTDGDTQPQSDRNDLISCYLIKCYCNALWNA
jgi:hypothetical protein